MSDELTKPSHLRAVARRMLAVASTEKDQSRRVPYAILAAEYVALADAIEQDTQSSSGTDSIH